MKKLFSFIFVSSLVMSGVTFGENLDAEIRAIAENLKRNTVEANDFGATQRVATSRLTSEGEVSRVEEKTFRTQWSGDRPVNVLIGVRCTDYSGPIRNSRECVEFTKAAAQKSAKPGKFDSEIKKIRWLELYKNFDFQMVSKEGAYQVLSFQPKLNQVDTQNRLEKILTHMAGKVWVDSNFNIVKAEAHLVEPVGFGLGLAAKVNNIVIRYEQQQYKNVFLPSHLNLEFNAKVALLHTERQRIDVSWRDPFRHSDGVYAQVEGSTSTESLK